MKNYNVKKIICIILCLTLLLAAIGIPKHISGVKAANETETVNESSTTETITQDSSVPNDTPDGTVINNTASDDELRGVWISFLSYNSKGYTKESFTRYIQRVFDNCVNNKMNAVFVHVRMFSDAMYSSRYFPWSSYASGKQGRNPGFDPLDIMIKEAHSRGLKIHAWINPYRITNATMKTSYVARNSYAYKWMHSKNKSTRRNVLKHNGALYFNPARSTVRNYITNGIKEIVNNYNVDGIHFDDYFYPNLGSAYKKNFDYKEYRSYVKSCRRHHKTPLGIVAWRRSNVNRLVRMAYTAVKNIDSNCEFGISPAGYISNLYSKCAYYSDVKKWMKTPGYIDYICPQIYWSQRNHTAPYNKICNQWASIKRLDNVKLYTGLAAYRAGISKKEAKLIYDKYWAKSNSILKRQIQYGRTKGSSGFIFFSYEDFVRSSAKKEIKNAVSLF